MEGITSQLAQGATQEDISISIGTLVRMPGARIQILLYPCLCSAQTQAGPPESRVPALSQAVAMVPLPKPPGGLSLVGATPDLKLRLD